MTISTKDLKQNSEKVVRALNYESPKKIHKGRIINRAGNINKESNGKK